MLIENDNRNDITVDVAGLSDIVKITSGVSDPVPPVKEEDQDIPPVVPPAPSITPPVDVEPVVLSELDGNLVDEKGVIVHKAGTFTIDKDGVVDLIQPSVIDELRAVYEAKGVKFVDADAQPLQFEDTQEGMEKFVNHLATITANDYVNEFLLANPEIVALHNHLQTGKPVSEYYKAKATIADYSTIKLAADGSDKDIQQQVIIDYLQQVKGFNDTEAREVSTLYKDAGSLATKSKEALTGLQQWQSEKQIAEQAQLTAQLTQQQNEWKIYNATVAKVIGEGKLHSVNIVDTDKQAFQKFLTDTSKGNTPAQAAYDALTIEQRLELDYFMFKGFKVGDLVQIAQNQRDAESLKLRKATAKPIVLRSNAAPKNITTKVPIDFV